MTMDGFAGVGGEFVDIIFKGPYFFEVSLNPLKGKISRGR